MRWASVGVVTCVALAGCSSPGSGGPDAEVVDSGSDAGGTRDPEACDCAQWSGVGSLRCYCKEAYCPSLGAVADGGYPGRGGFSGTLREYADCQLIQFTYSVGADPQSQLVFDLQTGELVGGDRWTDIEHRCATGPGYRHRAAGTLVDAGCIETACRRVLPRPDGGTDCRY